MEKKNFYLGLDIGTDSVGYAVTDENYQLLKYHGEPMWGSHIFEKANSCEARRTNRSARRRLDRRQQRLHLTQEIFAKEIAAKDPKFFKSLNNSFYVRNDTEFANSLFNDKDYKDADYHKQYPTIHHLINELMMSKEPHDIRLVYLAVSWLIVHRGHFLSEVNKENVSEITDFSTAYNKITDFFGIDNMPWNSVDLDKFAEILKANENITEKKKQLKEFLYNGTIPKDDFEVFPYSKTELVTLLAGGSVSAAKLFGNTSYSDIEQKTFSLGLDDDKLSSLYADIGDDADLVVAFKSLYDWAILVDMLQGCKYISEAKIKIYNQHHDDLKNLKEFITKYAPDKYDEIFKLSGENNYVAYSYNIKNLKGDIPKKKVSQVDFCDYIFKIVDKINPEDCDKELLEIIKNRLKTHGFMPKQKTTDNRVIPYQLYWIELNTILENAAVYLGFLNEKDADGLSAKEKLLSIFEFRVPYFVGPLISTDTNNAWIVRKSEKIYPWNFDKIVDLEATESAFINKLINNCTYLPGQKVLPKNSLTYSAFTVLNEINNIKVNGEKITIEAKQGIFNDLFMSKKNISVKNIKSYLVSNGFIKESDIDTLSGLDENVNSSLAPHIAFSKLKESGTLTDDQIEQIIEKKAEIENRKRFISWLKKNYSQLADNDVNYIANLRFKDFGRLSKRFLLETYGVDKMAGTGELISIMNALWTTNCNLMEVLSDRFTFKETIDGIRKEYYAANPLTLSERLDDMWVSNAVKRPIIRSLDIVSDVVRANGCAPKKIFIEMARDIGDSKKGQRTKTRRAQLEELYKSLGKDAAEISQIFNGLDNKDNKLQSDKIFLYFLQLGKNMYTGKPIPLESILNGTGEYNIDHIYPQAFVKDDSLLNNKVLVDSDLNGRKKDDYPINEEIRTNMHDTWTYMHNKGLISDEKFKRLIRSTPFTAEERYGFINRQLVETRQSTKAVATILKEKYPDTEIVYVKAGLVSDYRHEFKVLKSRSLNDLHHAKDAYLNIVCGNVYHEKFTSRWFDINSKYSIKTGTIFGNKQIVDGKVIWNGEESIANVAKILHKNNAHYTRYQFIRSGELFDINPLKANTTLYPLKKNLDPAKYGGYNSTKSCGFVLVKYQLKGKSDLMIMPIEQLSKKRFLEDDTFAEKYCAETIKSILGKAVTDIDWPIGKQILKINTMLSLDGYRVCITGKSGGGKNIIVMPMVPLAISKNDEQYIKRIESVQTKLLDNKDIQLDVKYDGITKEQNLKLYDVLSEKLRNTIYKKRPGNPSEIVVNGRDKFDSLKEVQQIYVLLQLLQVFNTMTSGCDLSKIGGAARSASTVGFSNKASVWMKNYSEIKIINQSASGIYEGGSCNLLDLIK